MSEIVDVDEQGPEMKSFAKYLWRRIVLLPLIGLICAAPMAFAQDNSFAPAIIVNGKIISTYELKQRIIFFSMLQPNQDATKEARSSLIDDRLRLSAAEALAVEVSPEDLKAAMESFAARVNLSADDFIKALAPRGVSAETFRDFVQSGLIWRETIRRKFLSQTKVSEAQIDRAITGGIASGGELKLLLSEIVLKTDGPNDAVILANRIKGDVTSSAGFSAAAALHSSAPTADRGGQLEWVGLSNLPPEIVAKVADLEPGQMTDPIVSKDRVMLLFVRDRSTSAGEASGAMAIDYVRLVLPPGSDVSRIVATVDRCEDLLPFGRGLPEEAIQRETIAQGAAPGDISAVLDVLDAGESQVITNVAGFAEVIMLCSRVPLSEVAPSRDDVRSQILNQKMALRAQAYLEELRTQAFITEP
jgi:peptidyl-prolyl cis-trans isomerase SurA